MIIVTSNFPSSLSPSRANDFQNCPLKFRLRNLDRIPEAPSAAALRGNLVHTALERLFDLPAHQRTVSATAQFLHQAWLDMAEVNPEGISALLVESKLPDEPHHAQSFASAMVARIQPLLETYFTLEDPTRLQPHAREMAVDVSIAEGFGIRGFIDRIDIAPAGQVRIVDYKTGKAPRAGFESKILSIRVQIQQAVSEGFKPKPSRLCGWCSYQHLCPKYGGSIPELPHSDTWESTTFESVRTQET